MAAGGGGDPLWALPVLRPVRRDWQEGDMAQRGAEGRSGGGLEQQSSGVAEEEVALVAWCGLTAGRAGREWERMGGGASIRGWGGGREDRHPHPPYNLWKGGAGGLRRGRSRPPSTCLLPPPVSLLYMSLIPPPVPFFHLSHHPILERRSNVLRLPAPPVLTLTNTQKLHIFTHLDSLTPSGPP